MKPLILIGGGGHCKSAIEAAESAGYSIAGVLDNQGDSVLGYPVLGTDDDLARYAPDHQFVVAVGQIKDASIRRKIVQKVEAAGGVFATVVASTARVSRRAKLGAGTVVLHGAVVGPDAQIGAHCIVNTLANIEHDAAVGDFCHVSTGATVNGGCRVGNDVFLGSGSVLLNGAEVCADCVVAAASFVRKSIVRPGVYAGNPAVLMIKR